MLITSLLVPGIHLECKSIESLKIIIFLSLIIVLKKDWFKLLIFGNIWECQFKASECQFKASCGDYMFSGHNLLNLFITEFKFFI